MVDTHAKKVCIVGSGNWGMAIAKIIGSNVEVNTQFQKTVPIYVRGHKLAEIINTQHENVKYLPGHKVSPNIVAVTNLLEVVEDADIIVFVTPHQFVTNLCRQMKDKVKPSAICVSLIKGLDVQGGMIDLISNVIMKELNIPCAVLMGANIANEVACEMFCETTIGCRDTAMGAILKELFETLYFKIKVVSELETVELCGALKNIVGVGAGFIDGLKCGSNTKAAIIRIGFMEMIEFCNRYFPKARTETFLESCGFADLITTCYSGRNRKVGEAFIEAQGKKSIEKLEEEMLNGQKLQGPSTATEVYAFLSERKELRDFPLFVAVHRVCIEEISADKFLDCLKQ